VAPRNIDLADGDAVPKETSEPGLQLRVEFIVAVAFGVLLGFVLAWSCWPGCLVFVAALASRLVRARVRATSFASFERWAVGG
jgi:hypothetical protein